MATEKHPPVRIGEDPNELIQRQVSMKRKDWDRAEAVARNAKYPTSRSQVFPAIIADGLDVAEKERA